METRNYSSIGSYDKMNNLVRYIEFVDGQEQAKCSYSVEGKVLKRTFMQGHRDEDGSYSETLNSIFEYSDNIMLFSMHLDGETYLKPILSGNSFTSINTPDIINTILSCQPSNKDVATIESFSIKSDLINDYLKKL